MCLVWLKYNNLVNGLALLIILLKICIMIIVWGMATQYIKEIIYVAPESPKQK